MLVTVIITDVRAGYPVGTRVGVRPQEAAELVMRGHARRAYEAPLNAAMRAPLTR